MDITLSQFHDAELNAIAHDPAISTACLSFSNEDGTIAKVVFDGLCGLRVVDYGLQNIVSRLLSSSLSHFTHEDIVRHVIWINNTTEGKCLISAAVVDKLVGQIEKNEILLFVLEPSWGAEISVLARDFTLKCGRP
jgi:hypothetical protein